MTTGPVRAGSAWLALREPADADARSDALVEILRPRLPATGLVVHDLGSGTGSTARWLAPRLAGGQRWVLHDRDPDLLDLATGMAPPRSSDGGAVTIETRLGDITRLDPEDLADASLVTASALLDMLTGDELARFVATCAGSGCPVLVTLSVLGRVELDPGDPLDPRVVAAFNAHQRRATPGGDLLGPDAATPGRRGLPAGGARGHGASQPVAPRARPRGAGDRVAERLGRGGRRPRPRSARGRRGVHPAPPGAAGGGITLGDRGPPRPAGHR